MSGPSYGVDTTFDCAVEKAKLPPGVATGRARSAIMFYWAEVLDLIGRVTGRSVDNNRCQNKIHQALFSRGDQHQDHRNDL